MNVNKEANKLIVEKSSTIMQLLGPNYYDTLFNSDHKEKIGKLGKLFEDNKLFYFPRLLL